MADIQVRDIAKALYKGNIERFSMSKEEGTEIVKNAILDAAGCRDKWDVQMFMHNKHLVFKILQDVLADPIVDSTVQQYKDWVDVKNVAYGETYAFKTMDNSLFRVGVVADGTTDFRRQRLVKGKLPMSSFNLGTAIYEEFDALRRGEVDFVEYINRVKLSFDAEVMNLIVGMIETSYDGLDANFQVKGSYSDTLMIELVQRVQAKSKKNPVIYGTKAALANLTDLSDAAKNELRENGHVKIWNGTTVVEIPQSLDANDDFVVNNKTLFIIPDGTKIVKLLMEGEPFVNETTSEKDRDDQQISYAFMQSIQIGVAKSSVYGMYVIQ